MKVIFFFLFLSFFLGSAQLHLIFEYTIFFLVWFMWNWALLYYYYNFFYYSTHIAQQKSLSCHTSFGCARARIEQTSDKWKAQKTNNSSNHRNKKLAVREWAKRMETVIAVQILFIIFTAPHRPVSVLKKKKTACNTAVAKLQPDSLNHPRTTQQNVCDEAHPSIF